MAMNNITKILIGVGVVVGGYQAWKIFSKPKVEAKSNASGSKTVAPAAGLMKYNPNNGLVFKQHGTGFDARWVALAKPQQPKAMDWYNLNGKWVWTKWNGKLDTATIPKSSILK